MQRGALKYQDKGIDLANIETGNSYQARPGYWLQGQLTLGESHGFYKLLKECLRKLKLGELSIQNEFRRNQYDARENNLVPPEVGESVVASQSAILSALFGIKIKVLSISEYENLKPIPVTDKNGITDDFTTHKYKPLVSRVPILEHGNPKKNKNGTVQYEYQIHCGLIEDDKLLERAVRWCFAKKWQDDNRHTRVGKHLTIIRKICSFGISGFNGEGSVNAFIDNFLSVLHINFHSPDGRYQSFKKTIRTSHLSPPISCEVILENYKKAAQAKYKNLSDYNDRLKADEKLISAAYLVAFTEYRKSILKRCNIPSFVHATRFADIMSKEGFAPDAHMIAAALLSRLDVGVLTASGGQKAKNPFDLLTKKERNILLTTIHSEWVQGSPNFEKEQTACQSAKDFLASIDPDKKISFYMDSLYQFRAQKFLPSMPKDPNSSDFSARWWSDAYLLRALERVKVKSGKSDKNLSDDIKQELVSGIVLLSMGETIQRLRNSHRAEDPESIIKLATLVTAYTAERVGAKDIPGKVRFAVHRLSDKYNETKIAHAATLGLGESANKKLQEKLKATLRIHLNKLNSNPNQYDIEQRDKKFSSTDEKSKRETVDNIRDINHAETQYEVKRSKIAYQADLLGVTVIFDAHHANHVSPQDLEEIRHGMLTALGYLTIGVNHDKGTLSRINVLASDMKDKGIVFQRSNFNLDITHEPFLVEYENGLGITAHGSLPERAMRILKEYDGELNSDVLSVFINPQIAEEYLKDIRREKFLIFQSLEKQVDEAQLVNVLRRVNNCVIEEFGRISFDKDLLPTALKDTCSTETIEGISEFIDSLTNEQLYLLQDYIHDQEYQSLWSTIREALDITILASDKSEDLVYKLHTALKNKCDVEYGGRITADKLYSFLTSSENHHLTMALGDFFGLVGGDSDPSHEKLSIAIILQLGLGPTFEIQVTDSDNYKKSKFNNSNAKYQNGHGNLKIRDEWVMRMFIAYLQSTYKASDVHSVDNLIDRYLTNDRAIKDASSFLRGISDQFAGQQFDTKTPELSGDLRKDIYRVCRDLDEKHKSQVLILELPTKTNDEFGLQFPLKLSKNATVYDVLSHVITKEYVGITENEPYALVEVFNDDTKKWNSLALSEVIDPLSRVRVSKQNKKVYDLDLIPDEASSPLAALNRSKRDHPEYDVEVARRGLYSEKSLNISQESLDIYKKYTPQNFEIEIEQKLLLFARQYGFSDIDDVIIAMSRDIYPITVSNFKSWCKGSFVEISASVTEDRESFKTGIILHIDEEQAGLLFEILSDPLLKDVNLVSASIDQEDKSLGEEKPRALHLKFNHPKLEVLSEKMTALAELIPHKHIGRGNGHITRFPKTVQYELSLEDKPGFLKDVLKDLKKFNVSVDFIDIEPKITLVDGISYRIVNLKLALPESIYSVKAKTPLLKFNPLTTIEPIFWKHSRAFRRVEESFKRNQESKLYQ